jgi:dTDP-4-amino-4,6-dideoxygalactose transaminase
MKRNIALLGGTTNFGDVISSLPDLLFLTSLVDGDYIKEYENAFAEKVKTKNAVSFSAGRVGLFGLLKSLNIGSGDEVIMHVPSHIVVPNAIRYTGAKPVYVDCNLNDYNIDYKKIEEKVTSRSKCLIVQHTFGVPAEIDQILEIAKKHNLFVIEDCVHALGAEYKSKPIGSFGKAAFFSTEETKMISTTMGGIIVTDDDRLAGKMKEFQNKCSLPGYWLTYRYVLKLVLYHFLLQPSVHRFARAVYEFFGNRLPLPRPTSADELIGKLPENYETRFSNSQSRLGIRQLDRLEENLRHRRMIADFYRTELEKAGLKFLNVPDYMNPSLVRYPIWVKDRYKAAQLYKNSGVLGMWFTSVLEEAVSPEYGEYVMGSCPLGELSARHLINLPTHSRVKLEDADRLLKIVKHLVPGRDEELTSSH